MTELAVVLPLLLAAVVALSIVVFVRVASAALRQTRGDSRSGFEVGALAERLERTLDEVVRTVDPARNGEGEAPLDIAERTAAFGREVRAIADAARHLEVGRTAAPAAARDRLLGAARQADDALSAVAGALVSPIPTADAGLAVPEPRRSAERSLKRAYLDLVHARDEATAVSATSRDATRPPAAGRVGSSGSGGRGGATG